MFKKTKIAAATLALLGAAAAHNASAYPAGSATALDQSGQSAQVLVFPFYNVNNGFSTGFNIRNTTGDYKAVKLRFRESKLSNDVLDFNVYMSPYDHFSFSVSPYDNKAGDVRARLMTSDKTCTFPAIPAAGVALKSDVYKYTVNADANEGYLEVIEMGTVDTTATVINSAGVSKLIASQGILHTSAGVPNDCSLIKAAWDKGVFTEGGANAAVSGSGVANDTARIPGAIKRPTGGLAGWSFLLDTDIGVAYVANPAAIRNYQTLQGQHYRSDRVNTFLLPSLASGNITSSVVADNTGTAMNTIAWPTSVTGLSAYPSTAYDYVKTPEGAAEVTLANGGQAPDASGNNPFPIAHVLAATGLTNDYVVTPKEEGFGKTDWVVTMPMRKHGIYSRVAYANQTTAPYITPTGSEINMSANFYSREEQTSLPADDGFSPVSASPANMLEREVNVISFGNNGKSNSISRVLRSNNTKNVGVDFGTGWADVTFTVNTTGLTTFATTGTGKLNDINTGFANKVYGVPALGFAAMRGNYLDGDNYVIGETVPHTMKRDGTVKP